MYTIYIYYIDFCLYSENALKKLKNIKHKKFLVPPDKKHLYTNKYINTFPQIYLKKDNSIGSLLIGGYEDLDFIIDTLKKYKDLNKLSKILNKRYNNKWSKKAIFRLIELFIK
jgi:hypothetical protein